jgi:hypothetical protein
MRKISGLVFHHSATSPPDSSDGQKLYRMSVDPDHLKSRGILSNAEYHFIIARNGRLIRCAKDSTVLGHCGSDRNFDTIGICCEGNLLFQKLSDAQWKTLLGLTKTLVRQYGIKSNQLLRHKDVMATACPGLNFPIENLRAEVSENLEAKPSKLTFVCGSREVRIEYPDAPGFYVFKVMDYPCKIVAGKSRITKKSALMLVLPVGNTKGDVLLRDFARTGFEVSYNAATREVVLLRGKNGR